MELDAGMVFRSNWSKAHWEISMVVAGVGVYLRLIGGSDRVGIETASNLLDNTLYTRVAVEGDFYKEMVKL